MFNMTTFKGGEVTLLGNKLKVGDKAPNFSVLDNGLEEKTLADYKGKVKLIAAVPSVDTSVCSQESRRFNVDGGSLENTIVLTISNDLPFAQKRWCAAEGLPNAVTLSDHKELSFGLAYGVVIEELRLLSRAVFVINANDEIVYVEYLDEVTNHPNYEAAIEAAKNA
nr:thiol peroxidase [Brochothrix thermosphacta]